MADKEKEVIDEQDELVVVMTDEDGNEFYYREELIIPVGDKKFALLVGINEDEEHDCESDSCECGCEDEDVFIARIELDENGEEVYVDPTDEEFEEVQKAYDEFMADDEK